MEFDAISFMQTAVKWGALVGFSLGGISFIAGYSMSGILNFFTYITGHR